MASLFTIISIESTLADYIYYIRLLYNCIQALSRLSTYEVSGTLIAKPTDSLAKSKKAAGDINGADIVNLAGFENEVFPPEAFGSRADGEEVAEEGARVGSALKERLEINSAQLAALFRKKPELAEFIFLELIAQPLKG